MAKLPAYRLQVLFDIREKEKKAKEEAYAAKKAQVIAEQKKLDEMKQKLRDMIAFREDKKREYVDKMRSGELTIGQITGNDRHIEKLKQQENAYQVEINRQMERVADAERECAAALDEMVKANQEFKALEKHKEKWVKGVKKEQLAKEEDAAEDIAQAQYFARLLDERGDE